MFIDVLISGERERGRCALEWRSLHHPLGHHGAGHFHETGYVGALYVIDVFGRFAVFEALCVYFAHDLMQFAVYLIG